MLPLHIPQAYTSRHFPGGEEVRISALGPSLLYYLAPVRSLLHGGGVEPSGWTRKRFCGERGMDDISSGLGSEMESRPG